MTNIRQLPLRPRRRNGPALMSTPAARLTPGKRAGGSPTGRRVGRSPGRPLHIVVERDVKQARVYARAHSFFAERPRRPREWRGEVGGERPVERELHVEHARRRVEPARPAHAHGGAAGLAAGKRGGRLRPWRPNRKAAPAVGWRTRKAGANRTRLRTRHGRRARVLACLYGARGGAHGVWGLGWYVWASVGGDSRPELERRRRVA